MCPNKLQAIRGLQPLQSKPAKLEGYSLRFDHRGGFGNLVKVGESSGAAEKGVVHGVLHQLSLADMGSLMNMEHEYWYGLVWTNSWLVIITCSIHRFLLTKMVLDWSWRLLCPSRVLKMFIQSICIVFVDRERPGGCSVLPPTTLAC